MKLLKEQCISCLVILALMRPDFVSAQDASLRQEAAPADPAVIDVLDLNDTDIWDIINVIVEKTGLKIVAGDNVAGRATLYLENVEARDALRIILEANAMAYAEEGDTLYLMTAREFEEKYGRKFHEDIQSRIVPLSFAEPADMIGILEPLKSPEGKLLVDGKSKALIIIDTPAKIADMMNTIKEADIQRFTMVFELGYAKAADLSKKVEAVLTPNVGKIRFDEKSNKVIVTDTSAKIEEVRKIVNTIDRRDRQVVIETKVVQITLNDEHRTGVDWEAIVSDYRNLNLSGDKKDRLSMGTIANEDYAILLEALDTVGNVDILSNPSIATANNKEARILVALTRPSAEDAAAAPSAGSSSNADIGMKLYVTPAINADSITLKIRPEINSTAGSVSEKPGDETPAAETSQTEATVQVKDGVTIVLGGLIKEEKSKVTKKVPVLGDVPFLGVAFRSYTHNVKKIEIVIFLKPAISTAPAKDVK